MGGSPTIRPVHFERLASPRLPNKISRAYGEKNGVRGGTVRGDANKRCVEPMKRRRESAIGVWCVRRFWLWG